MSAQRLYFFVGKEIRIQTEEIEVGFRIPSRHLIKLTSSKRNIAIVVKRLKLRLLGTVVCGSGLKIVARIAILWSQKLHVLCDYVNRRAFNALAVLVVTKLYVPAYRNLVALFGKPRNRLTQPAPRGTVVKISYALTAASSVNRYRKPAHRRAVRRFRKLRVSRKIPD